MEGEVYLDIDRIIKLAGVGAQTVLTWTAKDIRSAARKSMKVANQTSVNKKTGKSRKLRGDHSRQGEAPYRHRGTIYDLLLYIIAADKKSVTVGPKHLSGRPDYANSIPGKLERGGEFIVVSKNYQPRKRRNFSSDNDRDQNVNRQGELRAARPDRVNQTYEKRYRYFYSKDRWEAACQSGSFVAWGAVKQYSESRHKADVAARPFMVPAMEKIMAEENMAKKLKRILAKQSK